MGLRIQSERASDTTPVAAAWTDRCRIAQSSFLHRLTDVTQVERGIGLSTRFTHTVQVAEVGSLIVANLQQSCTHDQLALRGGLELNAVITASLAHDAGHPPGGHVGEEVLNDLALEHGLSDGFEANAQSFRIVTRLARCPISSREGRPIVGLNLSRSSLRGVLKYPWTCGGNPSKPDKWGVYDADLEAFRQVNGGLGVQKLSLEAETMDLADDVAYAIDDVLDFFRKGQLPLHLISFGRRSSSGELLGLSDEAAGFLEKTAARNAKIAVRPKDFEEALVRCLSTFPLDEAYNGSSMHDGYLESFKATLTRYYAAQVSLSTTVGSPDLRFPQPMRDQMTILKELTWQYVILSPELQEKRRLQGHEIRRKGAAILDAGLSRRGKIFGLLPSKLREAIWRSSCTEHAARSIIDFLASMTETEFADLKFP